MASSSKSYWPCQIQTHEYNIRSTSSLLYCIPNPINTGTRIMNNDNDLFMFGSEAKDQVKIGEVLVNLVYTYDKGNKHSTFGERCANKLWIEYTRAFR